MVGQLARWSFQTSKNTCGNGAVWQNDEPSASLRRPPMPTTSAIFCCLILLCTSIRKTMDSKQLFA